VTPKDRAPTEEAAGEAHDGAHDDAVDEGAHEAAELARLYDLDLTDDPGDLDLYTALAAATDQPILELGVGTGRLAIPLAAAGHAVTGVDRDGAMLDRARATANAQADAGRRLELVEGDIATVRLAAAGSFGLAFIALNTLMLLGTRDGQRAAVATLAAHLAPDGRAVVDVWQPDADDLARFDGRIVLEYARRDAATGSWVTKTASAVHDAARQSVALTSIYEASRAGAVVRRWIRQDRLRLVSADELVGMAEDAGLEVEQLAGGYDLEPLGPGSDRAILVARRRKLASRRSASDAVRDRSFDR
jgi:SAM-dependent methyltransferase